MLFRKAKEIKRLKSLLQIKESERRLDHVRVGEAQKEIATCFRDIAGLKRINTAQAFELKESREAFVLNKEALMKANDKLREELVRQRHERYEAFMKQRQTIEEQRTKIETLTSNLEAMNYTMAQNSKIYTDLCMKYTALNERMKSYEAIDRLLKGSK